MVHVSHIKFLERQTVKWLSLHSHSTNRGILYIIDSNNLSFASFFKVIFHFHNFLDHLIF